MTRSNNRSASAPDPTQIIAQQRAAAIAGFLARRKYGPYTGVPCGILSPLFTELEKLPHGFIYAPREDTAIAMACGSLTTGNRPVVVMQNSGLGQSVNALASLVIPYEFPLSLIISLRGVDPDTTEENQGMGKITIPVLDGLGIQSRQIMPGSVQEDLNWFHQVTSTDPARAAALLIEPTFFGWNPRT